MGLFATTVVRQEENHYHSTPDKVEVTVHEHKAVTDEAVKYMEDAHNKAMENIMAKVVVDDNLIKGQVFMVNQPWSVNDVKIICRFKINGVEHTVEKEINRSCFAFSEDAKAIQAIERQLKVAGNGIMLWYALKHFSADAYKQMTGHEFDFNYLISKT